jgi:3-oxoacyl-[acyl-carrier protein] reductase/(S)-1-phenylethanol dehydrogenase
VVIASSTFYINTSGLTHYVTSKGALIGLVHGLAGEIGAFGVTINAVAPGLTRTRKAVTDVPEAYFQHVTQLQSIPRNGTAEDQAGVVSFLVCDDAAFITGQTILADGGQGRT